MRRRKWVVVITFSFLYEAQCSSLYEAQCSSFLYSEHSAQMGSCNHFFVLCFMFANTFEHLA